jgi:phosphatidylserine decarboxylase
MVPMSQASATIERLTPRPVPDNLTSVQPGGGFCYRIELAWGGLRRWYLKRFRQAYVRRMAQRMHGSAESAPHEILDPRDLKYCWNRCTAYWLPADDPFRWREKIPLARWGLAETQIMGWPLAVLTVLPAIIAPWWWFLGLSPLVVLGWLFYFFRDPTRRVPDGAGVIVAPADGKVVDVTELAHDDFVGGPAMRIGIFLSIFNVHINRAPCAARAIEFRYHPGLFLNALNPESAERNESLWIALEGTEAPYRRIVVRQIAGLIARRIVCAARPGQSFSAGEKFGMIKLGSRTELILPHTDDLKVVVQPGDKIQAGATVVARYEAGFS